MNIPSFDVHLGGIVAASLAPFVTYLLGHKRAKTEAQQTRTDGFVKLTESLQAERLEMINILKAQMEENTRLRNTIREMDAAAHTGRLLLRPNERPPG